MPDPLYPFQVEGVRWLAPQLTAFLADEMGLGKSVEGIAAADVAGYDHITVIAPAIAVDDWRAKFEEWSAYGREIFCSYHNAPISPAALPRKSSLIASYNTAVDHRRVYKTNPHRGLLIIDEAHYACNPATRRARALYGGGCEGFGGISQQYDAVWCLSGSPTPNGNPLEIWPHLRALRPYSILGSDGRPMSYGAWRDHFCVLQPGLGSDKVIGVRNEEEYKAILRRFMLQRFGDVAGLPEVSFNLFRIRPRSVPRTLDRALWPELSDRLDAIIESADAGDLDAQLETQIASLRRQTGLLKIEATVDLLREELAGGQLDNAVVFAYHTDVVNAIVRQLGKFGATAITGATSNAQRWEGIRAFKAGKLRVLGAQIIAAGTNLSLGNCRNPIFAETDWVEDNNRQAAFRCRRIDGHREPVNARILSLTGTIDEAIQAATRRKMRQNQQLRLQ